MAKGNKKKKKKVKAIQGTPIVNPELKNAIDQLRQNNSMETQNALTEALKTAKLLSPVIIEGDMVKDEMGRMTLKPNQVKFLLINAKDGKTFFPAFTDIEETLLLCKGNKCKAARKLGISRGCLNYQIKKHSCARN